METFGPAGFRYFSAITLEGSIIDSISMDRELVDGIQQLRIRPAVEDCYLHA